MERKEKAHAAFEAAVSAYIRALKAIYINERDLWERARNGLYELIGFSL